MPPGPANQLDINQRQHTKIPDQPFKVDLGFFIIRISLIVSAYLYQLAYGRLFRGTEQGLDVIHRHEITQVVNALAHADQLDRQANLIDDTD